MKRTLKRLLPFFLCLVVIFSICWYLFIYDKDFTQDLLLSSARYFESQGNHSVAAWCYQLAYAQSRENDDVIIELAQRYKEMGNYTRAEVTLSDAIAEGGSVKLYIALSRAYVEQDKLMDAAEMLENVADPDIKAQLDSLRPSMPVANPAPGFYNQYITVGIENHSNGQLFVAADGDFPSVEDVYLGKLTLSGGENAIYAISVGENGLVSKPAYFGYTIGGVIEEVTIADPVMDALYRQLLGVGHDAQLFTDDLWRITSLTVPEGVRDFTDIGRLSYLQTLTMDSVGVENLSMLSALTQLTSLTIRGSALSAGDLAIIGSLPNLEHLVLANCSLSNISWLSDAPKLVSLDLSGNAIRDLTPLSFMSHLTNLNLSNNALTNLSALSALHNLQELDVSYNSITSLTPLSACPNLTSLNASYNQLAHLTVFQTPTVLKELNVSDNLLTDVELFSQFTELKRLTVAKNQLSDISQLAALNKLEFLDFSYNQVEVLPEFDRSCPLVTVNGAYNKLSSVGQLAGLPQLNWVFMDYNNISDLNPLVDCFKLIQVDVFGNPIKDFSKLTDMSVIVNYDPT